MYYLITFILMTTGLFAAEKEEKVYREMYSSYGREDECLEYNGYERRGGGSGVLHFRNRCFEEVEAFVCITFGKKHELRSPSRRIPKYGRWRLNLNLTGAPTEVFWSSARYDPPIPGPCAG